LILVDIAILAEAIISNNISVLLYLYWLTERSRKKVILFQTAIHGEIKTNNKHGTNQRFAFELIKKGMLT
jgi:hypothetical protein